MDGNRQCGTGEEKKREAEAMATEAERFYGSQAWKECRAAYIKSKGGLCERCLRSGLYRPGFIVHHKIYLDEKSFSDPAVALNWKNLELLCRECHEMEHARTKKRFIVDSMGRIAPIGS